MTTLLPRDHRPPLPIDDLIREEEPDEDAVPLDVIFVGGGPAGLSGAIELARLCKADDDLNELEIGVLEKASRLGDHCLSGAVVNPRGFRELFPEMDDEDFPFRTKVEKDRVYLLTNDEWERPNSEGGFDHGRGRYFRLPTPPTMVNHGNYVASICEMVRWLGDKAEELDVTLLTGYPGGSLLVEGDRVVGVRTTPMGLDRDGKPGGGYAPPTDVTAQITVLAEGTRGPLTQAYQEWQKIASSSPQIFALGVKEIWRVKKPLDSVIHTMGWPVPTDAFGGSFCYPMAEDQIAIGMVVGLDYREDSRDVHVMLQELKQHPLIRPYLEGGEMLEWGAKTIPEGGFHALPERFHGDGLLMIGDAVGFVDVPSLKGIHYAMMSGILAARSIFDALKAGDTSAEGLKSFDEAVEGSFIRDDMYETRNIRPAFKDGFFVGGAIAGVATVTKGMLPPWKISIHEDADSPKEIEPPPEFKPDKKLTMSKLDAVYFSGNATRDSIPTHLIVDQDLPREVAQFYAHMCPASVFEMEGDELIVSPSNCVDCKTTDVLGPRWMPREGGAGPKYRQM